MQVRVFKKVSRHRVFAVFAGGYGRGAVGGHFGDVGGEFVVGVEDLVVGHDLAGVGGHAAHGRYQAGFCAAAGFVVRLVLADGVHQVFPL